MAIWFAPEPGMILICDFSGHVKPEMVKSRRVVVLSPKRHDVKLREMTTIVVPLSETRPIPVLPWHYRIAGGRYATINACWAKADLVSHVSVARLDRIYGDGRRIVPVVDERDLTAIRRAVTAAIGLRLTSAA
jgi:uncharacterized protein YifN (PemK superfamily)